MTPVYHAVIFEGYCWNQCRVMTLKKQGKEITTVINRVICLCIFCLFLCMKKVDTEIFFYSLFFQLKFFIFDARRDFHVFWESMEKSCLEKRMPTL